MPEDKGNDRPSYGYTTEGGERVSALRDMFNGGGPGRSGPRFEGGGIISDIGNAMGGPSMFGGGDGGGNRGAQIGRMAGGMMFGPLGMIGGGILGNLLGGGMNRGLAQGVSPVPTQAPRPAGSPAASPAMAALARPMQRPYQPADPYMQTSGQQAPSFPAAMPSAVERFMMQYGGMPDQMTSAYPQGNLRMIPGAVPYNLPQMTFDALTGAPVAMIPPRVQ